MSDFFRGPDAAADDAVCLCLEGRYEEAIPLLSRILAFDLADDAAYELLIDAHINLSQFHRVLTLVERGLAEGRPKFFRGAMSREPLPCCARAEPIRIRELPHVYAFDFDLFQCPDCRRFWVWAWFNVGGWEPVTDGDVETMRKLDGAALRAFMKEWAEKFN